MPSVTCPSCGEKGRVPDRFVGVRIKCKTCGEAFVVRDAPKPAASDFDAPGPPRASSHLAALVTEGAPARPRYEGIEVEGLDESAWSAADSGDSEATMDHGRAAAPADASPAFVPHDGAVKQYKVLSPRDAFFGGKFDLELLEKALNHYARQGWVVTGFANPHVTIFGADKEQIVIILER